MANTTNLPSELVNFPAEIMRLYPQVFAEIQIDGNFEVTLYMFMRRDKKELRSVSHRVHYRELDQCVLPLYTQFHFDALMRQLGAIS
jgi:hypothetical protein